MPAHSAKTQMEGYIFSNPDDDFCLYSMSAVLDDLQFICDDKAESINIDSHYIYYSRYNFERTDSSNNDIFEVYDSGIFRINKDDTKKACNAL